MDWLTPDSYPEHPAVRAWQAHIDAGRIPVLSEAEGGPPQPPVDPAIAANRDATTALFRSFRRGARA